MSEYGFIIALCLGILAMNSCSIAFDTAQISHSLSKIEEDLQK